jgi:APA family basic amino acid/polyamine antiporter
MAWSYWISVWCSVAAIAVAFAGSMTSLAPQWFSTQAQSAACAIGVLWFCTALNLAGMRAVGVAQVVLTILKLLPLVAVILLGVRAIDLHAYTPFNPSGEGLLGVTTTTAALALWALLGLECATIPADHVVDAERTVPRATILGVAIGAVVTVAACMIAIGLVPLDALKESPAPFADAAQRFAGPAASVVMAAAMAVSCLGALNGWILVQGQIPLAAARDKLFPVAFVRVDRNDTPRVGLVIGSVLATLLVISNFDNSLVGIFTASILLATASALLPYLVCAAALWRLEPSARDARTWRRVAAALAFVFSAWALIGTGAQALEWGAGLLLAGLPVYAFMRRRPS